MKTFRSLIYEQGEDKEGRYLGSSMEDFVTGMRNDYNTLLACYSKDEMTPAFPETNLRKNEGDTCLHKEFHSMVEKTTLLL